MSGDEPGPIELRVRDELTAALRRVRTGDAPPPVRAVVGKNEEPPRRALAFNAAMARALLAGHKRQTRRPIRPLPAGVVEHRDRPWPADAAGRPLGCGVARVGETLWVREPWNYAESGRGYVYEADVGPAAAKGRRWKPGRFMARDACRSRLRVTHVWPHKLTRITPADARLEGMPPGLFDAEIVGDAADADAAAVEWFRQLWDGIYGGGELAWSADPWVWAVGFDVVKEAARSGRST